MESITTWREITALSCWIIAAADRAARRQAGIKSQKWHVMSLP
jgi:hypothetical protein